MKVLAFVTVLALAFASPQFSMTITPTERDVFEAIGGFCEGVGLDLEVQQFQACITDAIQIGTDLYQAVEDFERKTPDGAEDGIKMVGTAMEAIPAAISACKSGFEPELEKVESVLAVFKSPSKVVYDVGKSLLVNGHEIWHQIDDAVHQYKADNFFTFGKDIGEAVAECFNS
jgi:hypothetical protein